MSVKNYSGLRPPASPAPSSSRIEIATHYLAQYEAEFLRTRGVAKSRAHMTTLVTASAAGLIGVATAAVVVFDQAWIGLVSTGLAGLITVLASWEAHYAHRGLWVQRSLVLARIQRLRRRQEMLLAAGEDPDVIADGIMSQLDEVLEEDVESWAALSRS